MDCPGDTHYLAPSWEATAPLGTRPPDYPFVDPGQLPVLDANGNLTRCRAPARGTTRWPATVAPGTGDGTEPTRTPDAAATSGSRACSRR